MSHKDEFESILFSLLRGHDNTVPDLLDTIFEFLAQNTDFYVRGKNEAAEKLLFKTFRKYKKLAAKKAGQLENGKKKLQQRKQLLEEAKTVEEITNMRDEKLGKGLKNGKVAVVSSSESEINDENTPESKDCNPEENKPKSNSGNDCDLSKLQDNEKKCDAKNRNGQCYTAEDYNDFAMYQKIIKEMEKMEYMMSITPAYIRDML